MKKFQSRSIKTICFLFTLLTLSSFLVIQASAKTGDSPATPQIVKTNVVLQAVDTPATSQAANTTDSSKINVLVSPYATDPGGGGTGTLRWRELLWGWNDGSGDYGSTDALYFYDRNAALNYAKAYSYSNSMTTGSFLASNALGVMALPAGLVFGAYLTIDANTRNTVAQNIITAVTQTTNGWVRIDFTQVMSRVGVGTSTVTVTPITTYTPDYSPRGTLNLSNCGYF